ncbi:Kiwa anti-phage protein KwaB-like domain-containing protein [Acidaminococcus timonensis]|uniref:Kiwa anti-phage protein KwaB-like domain-containing protein n=1 Tax=Acidaminococcus timonensis TaxID=1871002 RepID=UPI00248BF962|nr:Kiwa anti-phage protein KwaB-like domain-containing protein [Acidaminococcus timonensis]
MEINDFITRLKSFFEKANRISCYALTTKGNNVSAQELKFESGELENLLNNELSSFYTECEKRQLQEYPYGNCKETIEYRDCNHESIQIRVKQILGKLNNPDIAYDDQKHPNFDSYVLKIDDGSNIVYLFTKKNPIVNLQKGKRILYVLSIGNKLRAVDTEMYQFVKTIDVIIFEENIYFVSLRMEKAFGLEAYSHKQKEKFGKLLQIVLDTSEFKEASAALKSKDARSFKFVNEDKIKKLNVPEEKRKIAHELNIPLTSTGEFDFKDSGCLERLFDYLQDKLAKDVDEPDQCVGGAGTLKKYT